MLYDITIRGAKAAQSIQTMIGTIIVLRVATARMIDINPPIRFEYVKPNGPSKVASMNAVRGDLCCRMATSRWYAGF